MKKILTLLMMLIMVIAMCGCGGSESSKPTQSASDNKSVEVAKSTENELKLTIPVKLKINGKTYEATFYDYQSTQSLLKQLPLTVNLNRGSRDFCGGNIDISYKQTNLVDRYEIGDLTYWIPGKNFVIFTNGDGKAAGKDLIPLGKLKASIQEIMQQSDSLEVIIEK